MPPSKRRLFFKFNSNPYYIEGVSLTHEAIAEYNNLFRNQLSTTIQPTGTVLGLFVAEPILAGE